MIQDRKSSPEIGKLSKIPSLGVKSMTLKNGVELHFVNDEDQNVCQIDLSFTAGNIHQPKKLVSASACRLLEDGTKKKSGSELIDAFDYYGAYIECKAAIDRSEISMYGLHRHLEKTIPLLREMITEPAYREEDVIRYKERRKQILQIQLNKVDVIASRKFMASLFGNEHPYGNEIFPDDYNTVQQEDLIEFHKNFYLGCKPKIFAAGKVDSIMIDIIQKEFGGINFGSKNLWDEDLTNTKVKTQFGKHEIKMPGQIQSGIKVGKLFPNIHHENNHGLSVLSTILGGYFGSRLMMNIREDKGYTYGIGSFIRHMKGGSYFGISTQVANEVYINTLKEIRLEIEKLRSEKISVTELSLVKNYLKGSLLRNFDGSFSKLERYKTLNFNDLELSYYDNLLESINDIDSVQLLQLANEHLTDEDFTEIVAGLA
ncbi:MAG: insulinase family protein [Bacteroidia bacterium]|nr:insulinase family protein [Bacteroidia bacterium]